jgi:hypothetical protein
MHCTSDCNYQQYRTKPARSGVTTSLRPPATQSLLPDTASASRRQAAAPANGARQHCPRTKKTPAPTGHKTYSTKHLPQCRMRASYGCAPRLRQCYPCGCFLLHAMPKLLYCLSTAQPPPHLQRRWHHTTPRRCHRRSPTKKRAAHPRASTTTQPAPQPTTGAARILPPPLYHHRPLQGDHPPQARCANHLPLAAPPPWPLPAPNPAPPLSHSSPVHHSRPRAPIPPPEAVSNHGGAHLRCHAAALHHLHRGAARVLHDLWGGWVVG